LTEGESFNHTSGESASHRRCVGMTRT
jgi:hypothetical protein